LIWWSCYVVVRKGSGGSFPCSLGLISPVTHYVTHGGEYGHRSRYLSHKVISSHSACRLPFTFFPLSLALRDNSELVAPTTECCYNIVSTSIPRDLRLCLSLIEFRCDCNVIAENWTFILLNLSSSKERFFSLKLFCHICLGCALDYSLFCTLNCILGI